jgi:hypothetical protein
MQLQGVGPPGWRRMDALIACCARGRRRARAGVGAYRHQRSINGQLTDAAAALLGRCTICAQAGKRTSGTLGGIAVNPHINTLPHERV